MWWWWLSPILVLYLWWRFYKLQWYPSEDLEDCGWSQRIARRVPQLTPELLPLVADYAAPGPLRPWRKLRLPLWASSVALAGPFAFVVIPCNKLCVFRGTKRVRQVELPLKSPWFGRCRVVCVRPSAPHDDTSYEVYLAGSHQALRCHWSWLHGRWLFSSATHLKAWINEPALSLDDYQRWRWIFIRRADWSLLGTHTTADRVRWHVWDPKAQVIYRWDAGPWGTHALPPLDLPWLSEEERLFWCHRSLVAWSSRGLRSAVVHEDHVGPWKVLSYDALTNVGVVDHCVYGLLPDQTIVRFGP